MVCTKSVSDIVECNFRVTKKNFFVWRVTNFDILTENNKFQHFRAKKSVRKLAWNAKSLENIVFLCLLRLFCFIVLFLRDTSDKSRAVNTNQDHKIQSLN